MHRASRATTGASWTRRRPPKKSPGVTRLNRLRKQINLRQFLDCLLSEKSWMPKPSDVPKDLTTYACKRLASITASLVEELEVLVASASAEYGPLTPIWRRTTVKATSGFQSADDYRTWRQPMQLWRQCHHLSRSLRSWLLQHWSSTWSLSPVRMQCAQIVDSSYILWSSNPLNLM